MWRPFPTPGKKSRKNHPGLEVFEVSVDGEHDFPGPHRAVPPMRFALVLAPEASPAAGPDLTRYLVVCGLVIAGLMGLAWVFRRFVAGHMRVRAAQRSLQVLDVLPLSGKHKLLVVRCHDRSFLLGLGEKEVRAIAELDAPGFPGTPAVIPRGGATRSFSSELESQQDLDPTPDSLGPAARDRAAAGVRRKEGLLA